MIIIYISRKFVRLVIQVVAKIFLDLEKNCIIISKKVGIQFLLTFRHAPKNMRNEFFEFFTFESVTYFNNLTFHLPPQNNTDFFSTKIYKPEL